jgi:hypothetical protein
MNCVPWAVSPEGRARYLGPIRLNRDKAAVKVAANLVDFALIVTAEPYFAVTVPGETVVLENEPRANTKGKAEMVDAKYELFQQGYWIGSKFDAIQTGTPAGAPPTNSSRPATPCGSPNGSRPRNAQAARRSNASRRR